MPHLSSLKLKCQNLPDDFFAAAASLAPSSQIQELDLDLGTLAFSPGTESAVRALAGLIFRMPRLTRLNLTCNNLPTVFYATAVSMPPSPQLTDITINGRPYQHRYDQEIQVLLQNLLPPEEDAPVSSDDEVSDPQVDPMDVETGASQSSGVRGPLLQPLLGRRSLRRMTLPKCRVS
ncbi:uncharacterized protein [Diadema setosum]|uniref:uncharacterized protein n=1 Tax=Diadema setosum TaxID=31175 RepID=UPI003B3BD001